MIINKLITEETFYSLIEMFNREEKEVSNKISGKKFKSFVVESEQYIFTDDLNDISKNMLKEYNEEIDISLIKLYNNLRNNGWNDFARGNNKYISKKIDGKLFFIIIRVYEKGSWPKIVCKLIPKGNNIIDSDLIKYSDDIESMIELINEFINKNIENNVNESFVGIDTDAKEYIQHHGKKPNGAGKWIFGIGSRNKKDWFSFDGNFTDAKNAAYEEAQKRDKKKIYVMEEFNFKFIDARFKIIKESNTEYRVSLISDNKELSVTKTLTENSARKIGSEWLLNKLIEIDLQEKKMTKKEKEKSEDIVKGMKKKVSDFKNRYGKKAKSVMYATANKIAQENKSIVKEEYEDGIKLWKFNKITGLWKLEKTISKGFEAEKWLKIFQEDEPRTHFKLSMNKPKNYPSPLTEKIEDKLNNIIEEESFKELSTEPTYRKPFKAVEAEPQHVNGWKIVDNLNQALAGVYTKEEAQTLVKVLNSTSDVVTMGYKDLYIKDGEGETIKDRSLNGVKLKESKSNNLINDLIENEYGTAHGGIQHFSKINGKEYSWNYVNIKNDRYNPVLNKKDAVGIFYFIGNNSDIGFGKSRQKKGFLKFENDLGESTKNFKIKFEQKSEDNSQITTGEKIIAAPDQVTARKRVEEDNKDQTGFRVISVSEVK